MRSLRFKTARAMTTATATRGARRMLLDAQVLERIGGDSKSSKAAATTTTTSTDLADLRVFGLILPESVPAWLTPATRAYAAAITPLIADPRDAIFVSYILFYLATVVPSAVLLLARFSWIHAVLHTVFLAVFTAPFILMLHCLCHRKIASPAYPWLDSIVHVVLSPFFGETWNTFYYHHVKHHHIEDNGPNDLSSTIWYDRDNAFHFLLYFLRFYCFIIVELPLYFFRCKKYVWSFNALFGEAATLVFYCSFFWLLPHNPLGVVFAWFVPLNLARFGMMSGNWAQHAFVTPDDPKNNYKTSITCISSFYNANCFNDGYHTSHHLNATRRWDDHPQHFVDQAEKYAQQDAIVFRSLDFHAVWLALMFKDYKTLAANIVKLPGSACKNMSQKEIMAFLEARTKRVSPQLIAKHYGGTREK